MKKPLFNTKTIVATGLGGALFMVLFMFVKVPSPVPETNLQIAYGISSFFAMLFGPIAGGLIAFIGHALSDFLAYGSPWWSWVFASGAAGAISGIAYLTAKKDIEQGEFDFVQFIIWNIVANAVAWIVVAPVLDIVIYAEPVSLVFTQGGIAFVMNAICSCVVGGLLCSIYAKTKTKEGSLTKK